MNRFRTALLLSTLLAITQGVAAAPVPGNDPLAAIDLNRNAIIADIVQGFEGDRAALVARLAALRADHLLSASLASTRASLESIVAEAEKSRDAAPSRASAKLLGSLNSDLVYTPVTPCRLLDTRGFGAPIQGGPFAPNERRVYAPNGACNLPTSGVATILVSFTTQNLTPTSGGYLAILGPAAPVTTTVDIFNFNAEWSASNTAVRTGSAAQFDIFVAVANPHVIMDVLGYFAPPVGGAVTSVTAGTGLTGGNITTAGTIAIAGAYQLPQACTNGQVPQSNGADAWSCVTPTNSGGTITAVTATAPVTSSGGTAPNISLTGGVAGQVLVGTAGSPTWTHSPSLSGNLTLATTTSLSGIVLKGFTRFIHDFGPQNTFIGLDAGNFFMTGHSNTGGGFQALSGNLGGAFNTALGSLTLRSNSGGQSNTATGAGALRDNTSGNFNTAVGEGALRANTTADGNTALGREALNSNTTGSSNTASGLSALYSNSTGINNTATGASALYSNTTGGFNTASGAAALLSNTTGFQNAAFGVFALQNNTTGTNNTAMGANAMFQNTTGINNTATGRGALQNNTTGQRNTASGQNSLFANSTGSSNSAMGFHALLNNTGDLNTAMGDSALNFNSTGAGNAAFGANALLNNDIGGANTALGANALQNNTSGTNNTASGQYSLQANTIGSANTATGRAALAFNTTGIQNTATGENTLSENTTGNRNVASGTNALLSNTTGSNNIAIGYLAGQFITTGSFNISIGSSQGLLNDDHTIRIGETDSAATTFIAGIRGVTTGNANGVPVLIDSDGQLGTVSSSRRFKDDVANMDAASSALMRLRPVTFHYKSDQKATGRTLQYGLIAEEVAEVYPGLVAHSSDGQVETVMYQYLPTMLLNEVQKQQRTIEAQAAEIAELKRAVAQILGTRQVADATASGRR